MTTWRDYLDERIKPYVERLIIESVSYQDIYDIAKDRGKAQLWVALGILSRQVHDLNLKLDYLEKALRDVAGPKLKRKQTAKRKKEEKEVEKFIKELTHGKINKRKTKKKRKKKTRKTRTKKRKAKKKRKSYGNIKVAKSL